MMKTSIFSLILTVVICGPALSAPEPAIVPKPGDWTLEVRFEQPQQMVLKGDKTQQRFWYIILNLTNKSDKDVDFFPRCELVTDTLQVLPAVEGASDVLFEKIKKRHQGKYPFLQLLENAGNRMLQGQDNALDIAVIFPDFDPNAKTAAIFISGLSNETVAVDHPTEKDQDGSPVKIYLRKTLQLTYSLAGDPVFRSEQKLRFVDKRWVMR
ncbi:MAG: hypothetical protein JW749_12895 [Sedimentisphaerales bacterium]|nr:hypothetical protein [Sedimentisphaerales bacterium]